MTMRLAFIVVLLVPAAAGLGVAGGRWENQSLELPSAKVQASPSTQPARGGMTPITSAGLDWPRVLISLGAVIGLILLLRLAMKKWLGVGQAVGAARSVRVLGRTVLGPRQQLLLIQVGRRVIVAGDSAGQLSALAQITDADEVASLIGSHDSPAEESAPPRALFSRIFGDARQPFFEDADDEDQPAVAPVGAAGRVDAPTESIEVARGELAGLMDRVRGLSKQFRKP